MKLENDGSIEFVKTIIGVNLCQMVSEDPDGDITVFNLTRDDARKLATTLQHFYETGEIQE